MTMIDKVVQRSASKHEVGTGRVLARRADGLNLSCVGGKVLKAVSLLLLQSSKDKHWNDQLLS
jgi:hypothetical protein